MNDEDEETSVGLDADRWLEIDLYWFDRESIKTSVVAFWERFAPMMVGVDGWRGVIVNTGWLVDHVLDWRGQIEGKIPFPAGIAKDKFFTDEGPLLGTETERIEQWRSRFGTRAAVDAEGYAPWTYGELGVLARELRAIAADQFDLGAIRVGTFVLGWREIYGCEPSAWAKRHPEAFFSGPWFSQLLDVSATLDADNVSYAAFPDGLPAGTPISRFFGQQWGHLARTVGLDAIVLRDSVIGQGIYERVGPNGTHAWADPERVRAWSDATAALIRETKQAYPSALVIGYSNAASAIGDWRVNCVDLESIAHEGFLDAWIDQTWAGAWNEVGQREDTFYNWQLLGWTSQLAFVLGHAAALVGSRVRHYTLAETFDAWESWDIIHTAPDRLRWGIWAYLHAFVLTPDGPRAPAGTYVSWANQGKRLLTAEDVDFLTDHLNAATADARDVVDVHGPTLVLNRPALEWQAAHRPEVHVKEWIDEQASNLIKYSVPITSITRTEWLHSVSSDLFVLQTPVHLPADQHRIVLEMLTSGAPLLLVGSPAGGLDPEIAAEAGLVLAGPADGPADPTAMTARVGPAVRGDDLPNDFLTYHAWTANRAAHDADVVYSVDGSPALVRRGPVLTWDAADVQHRSDWTPGWDVVDPGRGGSVPEAMGSPIAFLLAARELHQSLADAGHLCRVAVDADTPLAMASWTGRNGIRTLLVADTEEGFRSTTGGSRRMDVQLLAPPSRPNWTVELSYAQSQLWRWSSDEAPRAVWPS